MPLRDALSPLPVPMPAYRASCQPDESKECPAGWWPWRDQPPLVQSPATTSHSLTSPRSSQALTTSSSSQIHFLSCVCFVQFGRVFFCHSSFAIFLQTTEKDKPQRLPPKTRCWIFFSFQTGWSEEGRRNPESQPFIYFSFAVLLKTSFTVGGHWGDTAAQTWCHSKDKPKTDWGHLPAWLALHKPNVSSQDLGGAELVAKREKRSFKGETAWMRG